MRRFPVLAVVVLVILVWAGCGGSNPSTTTQIILAPTSMSLQFGEFQQLVANPENSTGTVVVDAVSFATSSTTIADVSTGGLVCAGTWDSESAPTRCTPPATLPTCPGTACTATITASVANGVKNTLTVIVHPAVRSLVVSPSIGLAQCLSQGGTQTFTVTACSDTACTTDITKQVFAGAVVPFTWTVTPSAVATPGTCTTDNTCVVTAAAPGQATVTATFSSAPGGATPLTIVSSPVSMTTCPIQALSLHISGGSGTTASIAPAATQALAVEAYDKNGPLTSPPLQFNTSQPATATAAFSGLLATAVGAGTSTITASCTPPSCNVGLTPTAGVVFGNPFTLTVTGSSSTTVYTASTTGTSLLPIDATSGTAAAAVTLSASPNSMVFAPNGAKLYLGSTSGLMIYDPAANTVTSLNGIPGKVLAVSPDSTLILIADSSTVRIYSTATSTATSIPVSGAVSAAWSVDGSKAYIATSTTSGISVYTTNTGAVTNLNLGAPVNAVDFLAQGSFAYLAGGGSTVSLRNTCDDSPNTGGWTTALPASTPAFIRSLPNATHVLAATTTSIEDIAITLPTLLPIPATVPLPDSPGAGCPPHVGNANTSQGFGVGTFTPNQLIVTPDSGKAYVLTGSTANLLVYDVASRTPSVISLGAGATGSTTGGVTLDSAFLFVGVAGTNTIHKVTVASGTEASPPFPVSVSFSPDLVAVRPK